MLRYRALFLVGVLLAFCSSISAATIFVPSDQPTIQAGIIAAVNGDTVMVAVGTYVGNGNRDLDFGGRLISLRSASGAEQTIIDCQADSLNKHYAFHFWHREDSTAEVNGFTIKHAYSDIRGAITCDSSAPSIRNCVFTENAQNGLRLYNGFGMIVYNCVFSGNAISGAEFSFCRVWMSECTADNNKLNGIGATNNTALNIANSQMIGNGNIGLLYVAFTTKVHVSNCTFVGNRIGFYIDGDFPKVQPSESSSVDTSSVINSIFAFNTDYGFEVGYFACGFNAHCNDWYGNPKGNFHLQSTGCPFDSSGNISANPLFCGTTSHMYDIDTQSPCAPSGNSCGVLMGRYQPSCTVPFLCGDANGDGSIDISDVVYMLQYIFAGGPPPVTPGSIDVNCDGSFDIADVVYLILYIFAGGLEPCAECK